MFQPARPLKTYGKKTVKKTYFDDLKTEAALNFEKSKEKFSEEESESIKETEKPLKPKKKKFTKKILEKKLPVKEVFEEKVLEKKRKTTRKKPAKQRQPRRNFIQENDQQIIQNISKDNDVEINEKKEEVPELEVYPVEQLQEVEEQKDQKIKKEELEVTSNINKVCNEEKEKEKLEAEIPVAIEEITQKIESFYFAPPVKNYDSDSNTEMPNNQENNDTDVESIKDGPVFVSTPLLKKKNSQLSMEQESLIPKQSSQKKNFFKFSLPFSPIPSLQNSFRNTLSLCYESFHSERRSVQLPPLLPFSSTDKENVATVNVMNQVAEPSISLIERKSIVKEDSISIIAKEVEQSFKNLSLKQDPFAEAAKLNTIEIPKLPPPPSPIRLEPYKVKREKVCTNDFISRDIIEFSEKEELNSSHGNFKQDDSKDLISFTHEKSLLPDKHLSHYEQLLNLCNQTEPLDFSQFMLENLDWEKKEQNRKLGEATFSEVFGLHVYKNGKSDYLALKVIPLSRDTNTMTSYETTDLKDLLPELIIAKILSLKGGQGFLGYHGVHLVKGLYPQHLMTLWDKFQEENEDLCENQHPDIFPQNQLYCILCMQVGQLTLEKYLQQPEQDPEEKLKIFTQVCLILAEAEKDLRFEHRDLHVGNILLTPVNETKIISKLGMNLTLGKYECFLIDFTFSRLTFENQVFYRAYDDPEIFRGTIELQSDSYREMLEILPKLKKKKKINFKSERAIIKELENIQWDRFVPKTNLLWLKYLKEKLELEIEDDFMSYLSCVDLVKRQFK